MGPTLVALSFAGIAMQKEGSRGSLRGKFKTRGLGQ